MAIVCPIDLDTRKLRDEIQLIYARVATDPSSSFHFHRGPDYAAEFLRYDRDALSQLPTENTASFAGVSNPRRMGPLGEGNTVADIGCGAGMDRLLAAKDVRPHGWAIGVDMTEAMRSKALNGARAAGLTTSRCDWATRWRCLSTMPASMSSFPTASSISCRTKSLRIARSFAF